MRHIAPASTTPHHRRASPLLVAVGAAAVVITALMVAFGAGIVSWPDPGDSAGPPADASPTAAESPAAIAPRSPGDAMSSPTPSPAPSATQTIAPAPPSPDESTAPVDAAWTRLGAIELGQGQTITSLVAFDGGYIAWGSHGDPAATWFSRDGAAWQVTTHSAPVVPCPGWYERPNLEALYSAATDGSSVVIVATILDSPTRASCDDMQLVSLRTVDGVTWERSAPFGSGWVESAWHSAGRFGVRSHDGTMWQSDDGLTWETAMTDAYADEVGFRVTASADDGSLLAVKGPAEDGQVLLVSNGAEPWEEVYRLPPHYWVAEVLAPVAGEPWLIAASDGMPPDDPATLLFSDDLRAWRRADFPRSGIGPLLPTSEGLIALGYDYSAMHIYGCGDNCPSPNRVLYWSADGKWWTELPSVDKGPLGSGLATRFVDGPAGIISIQPSQKGFTALRLALNRGSHDATEP